MLDRLKRAIARFRALLGGYFWRPCPVCGEPFGGHEMGANVVRPVGVLIGERNRYLPVCRRPACNSIAGFLEARELMMTDDEGKAVAANLAGIFRDMVDANSRGQL